jgi:elongation factor P
MRPHRRREARARQERRAPVAMCFSAPPRHRPSPPARTPFRRGRNGAKRRIFVSLKPSAARARRAGRKAASVVKVIASDVRKGNVLELEDGKLYVVMGHETFRPGKGTPTTTLTMRRIADGVKTIQTYKTTDGLEKAFVEEIKHTYLYQDGDNYVFMNPDNYEQVMVTTAMLGDAAPYLAESMECHILMFDGAAVSITLPPRVTLEIVETEPVVKGQTASSSYKPAKLANGVRTMVPPHIEAGTRIVVSTDDGAYVERAKD